MYMVAVWDFTSFRQFDIIFAHCLIIMHLFNRYCQYKACESAKFSFIIKRMLFAKISPRAGDLSSPVVAIFYIATA